MQKCMYWPEPEPPKQKGKGGAGGKKGGGAGRKKEKKQGEFHWLSTSKARDLPVVLWYV